MALLRVPGLGPKKIKALHDELKIESLADLRLAADAHKIAAVKGFGAKTEARIREGIAFIEKSGDRILQSTARRLVAPLIQAVRDHRQVIRAEVCGSLRRRADTCGDLDILFASTHPEAVLDDFLKRPEIAEVLAHGPTKVSVRLAEGVQCDVRGVSDASFPFALHYFTGSKAHNIAMRKRAIERSLKLNEYALEGDDGPVACETEADLFAALGLAFIPPELREDRGEIALAERGPLPTLIDRDDLTGTFHCHTDWSDGGGNPGRDGSGCSRRRALVPGHRRPLTIRRIRGRVERGARPPAVGRHQRPQREARRFLPHRQGHRVRHPARWLSGFS